MKDKFKMKNKATKRAMCLAVVAGLLCSAQASAELPVRDNANLVANSVTAAGVLLLKKSLTEGGEGTMLNYTANIDNSTHSIDQHTQNIDDSTVSINTHTENIDNYESWNYQIDNDYTWIISGGGGGEIIPIPDGANKIMNMLDGGGDEYANNFQDVHNYSDKVADHGSLTTSGEVGSELQKKANDAAVKTLASQRDRLAGEAQAITQMAKTATSTKGTNGQLQYANALAGAQADQLLQMRALMIASQNAQTAAGQASADRQARELAGSKSLRQIAKSTSSN